jgi:hypothetical protein
MRKNPFTKMEEKVIRKLYGNTATLRIIKVKRIYDEATGGVSDTPEAFDREIYISNPKKFADVFVDGENILKGDITVDVARETLVNAVGDLREDSLMHGKLSPEHDWLIWQGRVYTIRGVEPKNVYANVPGIYQLHLRQVAYENKT